MVHFVTIDLGFWIGVDHVSIVKNGENKSSQFFDLEMCANSHEDFA